MPLRPPITLLLNAVLFAGLISQAGCDQFATTPAERIEQAKTSVEKGDFRPAMIHLSNVLQTDPNNLEARWMLATVAMQIGDSKRAEKEIRRAIELGLSRSSAQPLLVKAILMQGDVEEALSESSPLATGMPVSDQARVLSYRAEALTVGENYEPAEREIEKALALNAGIPEPHTAAALLHAIAGRFDEAQSSLDKAFAIDANHVEAWSLRGQIELQREDYAASEEALNNAIQHKAEATAAMDLARRAHARAHLGKHAEAAKDIDDARALGLKDNAFVSYVSGVNKFKQGKFPEALEQFELSGQDAGPWLPREAYLATTHLILGNREQALQYAERVNTLAPKSPAAKRLLSRAQYGRGDFELAGDALSRALEQDPNDTLTLSLLADLSMQAGEYKKATTYYERLQALDPESSEITRALQFAKLLAGQPVDGPSLSSVAAGDEYAQQMLAAMAEFRDGRPAEALTQATRLHVTRPEDVEPLKLMAASQLALGRWDDARTQLNRVLELRPGEKSAARNLAKLEMMQGDPEAARPLLTELVQQHPTDQEAVILLAVLETALAADAAAGIRVLEAALETTPDALTVRRELAAAYLNGSKPNKVVELTKDLGRDQLHAEPTLMELRGKAQMQLRDFGAARRSFEQWTLAVPNSAVAHFFLAKSLAATGAPDSAGRELRRSVALDRNYLPSRIGEIKLLVNEGKISEAGDAVNALKKDFGDHRDVQSIEGWYALGTRDFARAASAFEAAATQRQDTELTILWTRALWGQQRFDDADRVIEDWLEQNPADLAVLLNLGGGHLTRGREQAARDAYLRLLKQYPENVEALNNVAWLIRDDDLDAALDYAEQAHKLAPDSPAVLDTYGALLLRSGQHAQGYEFIRQAADAQPDEPNVQLHLGEALIAIGQSAQGRDVLTALINRSEDAELVEKAKRLLASSPTR